MTTRPRTVLLTLVGPPLCGVLLACMVMAAWVGVGLPLAKGETWFTVQKVPPCSAWQLSPAARETGSVITPPAGPV